MGVTSYQTRYGNESNRYCRYARHRGIGAR